MIKMRDKLLVIDAIINFVLGVLLLLSIPFSNQVTEFLGVPKIEQAFYPSLLGGIFIGIGISLVIESNRRKDDDVVGLGLAGAITINICGGIVLVGWLLFGNLDLPIHGRIFLWTIAILLGAISSIEAITQISKRKHGSNSSIGEN
jgi:hypothetical protein